MGTRRYRSKLSTVAYLTVALFSWSVANADGLTLEIIKLQHAIVEDILPLVQPLVAPGGTAIGMHDQLIIKTTPANLAEIRTIIAAFDRAPKTLKITVKQDVAQHSQIQENAVSGRFRSGNFSGRLPDPGTHDGASIGLRDRNGNALRYRALNTQTSDDRRVSHFVTALEGRPALIQTGQSIPYPYSAAVYDRRGVVVHGSIDYREVTSGFYVTPRTHGHNVTLDIAPQLQRADPKNRSVIDTRSTSTTVSGRLGEWIPLGGVNEATSDNDSALLARTRRHGSELYGVWVKVEEMP
jgi:type II secretory pathway component GspD/PulD (secretin)